MALFKFFWSLRAPCGFLHQAKRYLASPIASHYEAINQGEKEMPEYFNFASDVMDKWTELEKEGKNPQRPVFWWVNNQKEEVKWSYEDLGVLSRKAANVLSGPCGLQRGDRVLMVLPRIPEWWLLVLACTRAGIVFIPGTSQLTAKDIAYRLQASKAKCIVVSETLAPGVDSIASECKSLRTKLLVSDRGRDGWLNFKDLLQTASANHSCVKTRSEDVLAMYFTSGTTGTPKMVAHSHCSYGIGFTISGRVCMQLSPSAILWNLSDPGWVKAAWNCVFSPWMRGACVFVHHLPQFEPTVILNTLASYPITTFCAPPTGYRMLVQLDLTRYKFMSLSLCVTGGEPLNPEVYENWKKQTGLDIYEGYGQTETVCLSKSLHALYLGICLMCTSNNEMLVALSYTTHVDKKCKKSMQSKKWLQPPPTPTQQEPTYFASQTRIDVIYNFDPSLQSWPTFSAIICSPFFLLVFLTGLGRQ